jgi:predicted dehydrogenase
MTVYRAGIIGLGIMGRRMLVNMVRHPRFTVAAAWDPAADSCARALDEAPGTPIADGAHAIAGAAGIDVVYVACPPNWHRQYCEAAIAAAKPVFCEKPLGTDLPESRALVARFAEAGVKNAVNFVQASGPAIAHAEAAVRDGSLGRVIGADITIRYQQWPRAWQADADWLRFRAQGGYTREVISHFVYFLRRVLGETRLEFARASYPADDPALCETDLAARFSAGGVPVTVRGTVGGMAPDLQDIVIRGSARSLRISNFYQIAESDGGAWVDLTPVAADPRAAALARQLDGVAAWLDGTAHPLPSAADALAVQELVEGMLG